MKDFNELFSNRNKELEEKCPEFKEAVYALINFNEQNTKEKLKLFEKLKELRELEWELYFKKGKQVELINNLNKIN